jgi:tetratricopeptide (TPR) repeat protein
MERAQDGSTISKGEFVRNRFTTTAIIVGLLVPLAFLHAQGGAKALRIEGQVRWTGRSAGPVRVQLQRLGDTIREQVSADGRFYFPEIPHGLYTLVVEAPGYDSFFRYVEVPGDLNVLVELGPHGYKSEDIPATTSVSEYQVPSSARREFESAQRRIRSGDCKGALDRLKKAIRTFARYADAHNAAGSCYVQLSEMHLAEESYKEAASLTSSVYPALNLADIYRKQSRIREAEEVLTSAIRRSPLEGDGYFGLAALRFEQNRHVEAADLAREAHRRRTHTADVHLLLAKIYLSAEQTSESQDELRLYVLEARPGPLRDRVEKSLSAVEGNRRNRN